MSAAAACAEVAVAVELADLVVAAAAAHQAVARVDVVDSVAAAAAVVAVVPEPVVGEPAVVP